MEKIIAKEINRVYIRCNDIENFYFKNESKTNILCQFYHRLKMRDNLENLSVSIENEKGEPIKGYFRLIFHLRKYAVSI